MESRGTHCLVSIHFALFHVYAIDPYHCMQLQFVHFCVCVAFLCAIILKFIFLFYH